MTSFHIMHGDVQRAVSRFLRLAFRGMHIARAVEQGWTKMRLIDADAIAYTMMYKESWLKGEGREAPAVWKETIDEMPTIDAVPVIRCRDCAEFNRWDDESGECYDGLADGAMVRADGYCYAAERMNDGIQK